MVSKHSLTSPLMVRSSSSSCCSLFRTEQRKNPNERFLSRSLPFFGRGTVHALVLRIDRCLLKLYSCPHLPAQGLSRPQEPGTAISALLPGPPRTPKSPGRARSGPVPPPVTSPGRGAGRPRGRVRPAPRGPRMCKQTPRGAWRGGGPARAPRRPGNGGCPPRVGIPRVARQELCQESASPSFLRGAKEEATRNTLKESLSSCKKLDAACARTVSNLR